MSFHIDLQKACSTGFPVTEEMICHWASLPLAEHLSSAELTLRFVNITEITELNYRYRQKNKATNVLAFPAQLPQGIAFDVPLLGDIIICPAVLQDESIAFNKPLAAHWAHIIIHGVLHLLGYDHIKDDETAIMQACEIKWLASLGFDNPYQIEDNDFE